MNYGINIFEMSELDTLKYLFDHGYVFLNHFDEDYTEGNSFYYLEVSIGGKTAKYTIFDRHTYLDDDCTQKDYNDVGIYRYWQPVDEEWDEDGEYPDELVSALGDEMTLAIKKALLAYYEEVKEERMTETE